MSQIKLTQYIGFRKGFVYTKSMEKIEREIIIILILCILSIFFSLYKIDDRYRFDWDQEDDAVKVMGMIENKKPLLIGQRVSHENSFFAGPYHFYYLLPFYGLMGGDPRAGIVAMTFTNLITVISMYIVASKLYGRKVGLTASGLILINQNETSWSVMYLSLFGIWGWWGVNKILESRTNIKWVLPLWGFFSVSHLIPTSILVAIVAAWLLSEDKKYSKKDLIIGIVGGLIFLTPLVVFDLRHDFLNTRKFFEMLKGETKIAREIWLPAKVYFRSLNLIGIDRFGQIWEQAERIIVVLISFLALLGIKKREKIILVLVWLLTPLATMFLYKGGVSEYYYRLAGVLLVLLISMFISNIGKVSWLILSLLLINNYMRLNTEKTNIGLQNKMEIVEYLVNQKRDEVFNVSYELPLGWDNGFKYLFKYLGKQPQNIDEGHLYTIMLDQDEDKSGETMARSGVLLLKRR